MFIFRRVVIVAIVEMMLEAIYRLICRQLLTDCCADAVCEENSILERPVANSTGRLETVDVDALSDDVVPLDHRRQSEPEAISNAVAKSFPIAFDFRYLMIIFYCLEGESAEDGEHDDDDERNVLQQARQLATLVQERRSRFFRFSVIFTGFVFSTFIKSHYHAIISRSSGRSRYSI